jgi:hypothetical protein
MGTRRAAFELKDSPIENQRPLKVRVIGAGYSGIYMGIRIPQRLKNVDLRIYEKNEGVGGTWWENRYVLLCLRPALSCIIDKSADTLGVLVTFLVSSLYRCLVWFVVCMCCIFRREGVGNLALDSGCGCGANARESCWLTMPRNA